MTVCNGKNCSKREQCNKYEDNFWKSHDNSKYYQYEDWSSYGSGSLTQDSKTGEKRFSCEYWCGDLSKDYKLFESLPIELRF